MKFKKDTSNQYVRAVRGPIENDFILSVAPLAQNVDSTSGITNFNVSNTGTGTMPWTAAVTSGGDWLSITSGATGTNTGTITCAYTANTGKASRTGTIRVTAVGATGSPVDVTVTQSAGNTKCTATLDGNLSLHIPLLSHLVPWWGAPSYMVDFVYEYNSAMPTLIPFRLVHISLAQEGVYECEPATLSGNLEIHIPDMLLPDGVSRFQVDMEYSKELSTDTKIYFIVTDIVNISNSSLGVKP